MRSNSFKSFCVFLVLIVLSASLCGCYDKKSCDEILRSADKLSKSLLDGDADTLIDMSDEKHDKVSTHSYLSKLDYQESFGEDKLRVVNYIHDSITYRIDRGSVDASEYEGSGSVDVYFSMIDYESVLNDPDNRQDYAVMMRTLRLQDERKEFRVTYSFVYEEGEWKLSNLGDVYSPVYAFLDVDVSIPRSIDGAVTGGYWCFCEPHTNDLYENTTEIDLDLQIDTSEGQVDTSGVYYVVSKNGETLYTSDPGCTEGIYGIEQEARMNNHGYMVPGEYLIAFFNEDDELLYYDTAVVTVYKEDPAQVDQD